MTTPTPTATTTRTCHVCRRRTEHVTRTRWDQRRDGTVGKPRQVAKCMTCGAEKEVLR